jgi:hypothetical protein
METSTAPDTQAILNEASAHYLNGGSEQWVTDYLLEKGIDPAEAATALTAFKIQAIQAKVDHAKKEIRNGAIWCIAGLVITIGSYAAVSDSGGHYLICWGAVVFGGIQLIRGVINHSSALKELQEVGEG